jgi:ATP-dependent Clp protease protease subunit
LKDKKYLQIRNLTDNKADLYFYGDIVGSEWEKWDDTDTCPEDVKNLLAEIDGVNELNIYVNSGGGSVFAGLAIYNMLKRNKAYKTVYVDGLAGSIASVITMAGNKIVIPSNAFLMIHKPWSGLYGNANDLRKMADDLDRIEEGIINVYADNLAEGVEIETIKEMVNAETWLNGIEAGKYFNVEVSESNKMVACVGDIIKNYKNVPDELLTQEYPQNEVDEDEITKLNIQLELL